MASDKTEQFNEQQFGREFPPETPWHELLQAAYARGYREALEKAIACIVPDGNPMVALEKMRALLDKEGGSDG